MDPREERFLASQAERLAINNKKQNNNLNRHHHHQSLCPPELVNDDDSSSSSHSKKSMTNDDIITIIPSKKETSNQFFTNFRKLCTQFECQIDALLFISNCNNNETSSKNNNNNKKYNDAKSYYVTSTRRNEGQIQLNVILHNVRLLQRHALSSSSSIINTVTIERINNKNDNNYNNNELLLQTILQTPMTDVTQTDVRLISQEIDKIIQYIDDAKEIVCPKEKFVFKRYRAAIAAEREMRMVLVDEKKVNDTIAPKDDNDNTMTADEKKKMREDDERKKQQQDNLRTKYGGVLENKSNCTIEISSHDTIFIDEQGTMDFLQYYSAPRSVHALHPSSSQIHNEQQRQQSHVQQQQESSSYLLQNLQNVTILIHGSRPSLHLQNISNCKIYISEPTLGPVHVTNCHSSKIYCSCYQLRIHDSKDVTFHVWVRSGPIIEDCTGITFVGDYYNSSDGGGGGGNNNMNENDATATQQGLPGGRNMYWDVKDFNWLRTLRKSPNFVVVTTSSSDEGDEGVDSKEMSRNAAVVDGPVQESVKPAVTEEEEEDSEDEL